MSKSDQHLQDIRSTAEEAELLQEGLKSAQPAHPRILSGPNSHSIRTQGWELSRRRIKNTLPLFC